MRTLLLASSLLIAVGCQTARMSVAPSLAQTEPFLVEGANPRRWNAPIRFGPWTTVEAREGFTWNFAPRLLGITVAFERQPYRLAISSGDAPVQAECVTRSFRLEREGLSVDPSFGRIPALACGLRTGGGAEGTLRLHETATGAESGTLQIGGREWAVRSVRRFEGSSIPAGEPLGYEFVVGDRVVGAVEIINRGRVWMDPSLAGDERAALAAAATALLMYEPADATD